MTTTTTKDNASRLLQLFAASESNTVVNVNVSDSGHGLFGELYSPEQVIEALVEAAAAATTTTTTTTTGEQQQQQQQQGDENVGTPKIKQQKDLVVQTQITIAPTTFLNSNFDVVTPEEVQLEFHNMMSPADGILRVRWVDQNGAISPKTHQWDVPSSSTMEQYSRPGHLFILSLVSTALLLEEEEHLLGAYRVKRALPTTSPHVLIAQPLGEAGLVLVEGVLLEKFDAMVVAAQDLDQYHIFATTSSQEQRSKQLESTVNLLHTIFRNLLVHDSTEAKYRKLRLSNKSVHKYIEQYWGAMELLRLIGFVEKKLPCDDEDGRKEEDYLVLPLPTTPASSSSQQELCRQGLKLLDILASRTSRDFIAELAPPTPWQQPPTAAATAAAGGGGRRAWSGRRDFLTPDDRWARAERAASLRRSAGRRPEPGEAPSSRGNWGR